MNVKFLFSSLILFLCYSSASAQYNGYIENETGASVSENNISLLSPWCGGWNATQIQQADLNNDGINDMVIFDHKTRTLKTFIKQSNTIGYDYAYAPNYAKNFPNVLFYLILKDYNCDGIADLFHRGGAGISVYTGSYVNNELTFTFFKELYFPGQFGPVNAYVQPNDIPSIEDLDRDGDLDFFSFDVLGATMPYYKNMQVENGEDCDSISIIQGATCWGNMYQTFDRTHQINASCKGGIGNSGNTQNKTRHTGNCLLHVDIDGDNDYDLFGGNVSFTDVQLLYNGGTLSAGNITAQDSMFDADGHELKLFTWPVTHYSDLDNDGKKDLFFTPHADDDFTSNVNNIALYKNTGTSAVPVLDWINDSTLINNKIDVGRFSYPTLFDYDKDGKKDLFVGNASYFNTNSESPISQLAYYKNVSTIGNMAFELVTKDFLNLSGSNYKGLYPCFGDITGDGVADLALGNDSGFVAVYRNIAGSNTVQANFVFETDSIPGIDVGDYSFPIIYDFNQDGKTDLLIGNQIGNIALYQDSSSTAIKDLRRVDSAIGDLKVGSNFSFFGYGAPFIGKIDTSKDEVLLIGTIDGTLEIYDSILNNYSTTFVRKDSFFSGIQFAPRAVPVVEDIDGDGTLDMIVGAQNGGLKLYKAVGNVSSTLLESKKIDFKLFPNPTKGRLVIESNQFINQEVQIKISDLTGRILYAEQLKSTQSQLSIQTESLIPGLYFLHIKSDTGEGAQKFMRF